MKFNSFLFGFLLVAVCTLEVARAQVPPQPAASPAAIAQPAQPQALAVPAPSPASVQVAEPAAPPKWAEDVIMTAQKLPIIGPILSKALVYAGVVSSILTALVACLLTIMSALSRVVGVAGFVHFAELIRAFQKGKVMYWLSYLSMFNAKKPEEKIDSVSDASLKDAA